MILCEIVCLQFNLVCQQIRIVKSFLSYGIEHHRKSHILLSFLCHSFWWFGSVKTTCCTGMYHFHGILYSYLITLVSGRPITFFSYRPIPIMTDNCNFFIGRYRCRYRLIIPISADTDTDYWYVYVIEQRQFLDNNFHMNIELY